MAGLTFAAWRATALEYPVEPPLPVAGERAALDPARNAWAPFTGGPLVRFPAGGAQAWEEALNAAAMVRWPVPVAVAGMLPANGAAVAAVRAAGARPAAQLTRRPWERADKGATRTFELAGWMAVVAFRVGGPGGDVDPARLADVLGASRRVMWAPDEAAGTAGLAATVAEAAYEAEVAERARLWGRPDADLAGLLARLNALDGAELPLERLLRGHRDHALPAGDRLDLGAWTWVGQPVIDGMREGARAIVDRRIDALARRDFAEDADLVATYLRQPPGWALAFHPFTAGGRVLAAPLPVDAWAHRVLLAEGRFDALRVGLAAELYRRRTGAPPATLAALVPTYLPAVPRDPYAPARPLGWDGRHLTSVGADGRPAAHPPSAYRTDRPGSWPPPVRRRGDYLLWPTTRFLAE